MIRTISQAVKYLEQFVPTTKKIHPGKLGLDRMRALIDSLDNPQNQFRTIHVGGTSGKGSTATIIATILSTKFKLGLHTSPHLERINERIKIFSKNGVQDVTDAKFVALINEIKPAIDKMNKSKLGAPSYFEIVTALALRYFAQKKADMAVIEVGMGGRFDATNVINPQIAVLTNVGLDHVEVLGGTVEEIAEDKAGIIKSGVKVVTGIRQPSVLKIIEDKCKRQAAEISLLGRDFNFKIKKISGQGSYFDYSGNNKFHNLFIPLLGVHQVENAALAIRAVEELEGIDEENIKKGLKNAFIPGRLEIISKKPLIVLDGAHNPDKIKALIEAVKSIWPTKKIILVMAIKEEKNAVEMLRLLIEISGKIILTEYEIMMDQGMIKSYDPNDLKKALEKLNYGGEIDVQLTVEKAVMKAKTAARQARLPARQEDLVLITGSLYLAGMVRSYLKRKK